jgi:hypothetical protein
MQTVLNQKPSCLLKGGLVFLLEVGGDNCRYVRKFVLIKLGSNVLLRTKLNKGRCFYAVTKNLSP